MVLSYEQWLIWTTIGLIGRYLLWLAEKKIFIDHRSAFYYLFWARVAEFGARLAGHSKKRLGYLVKWGAL